MIIITIYNDDDDEEGTGRKGLEENTTPGGATMDKRIRTYWNTCFQKDWSEGSL